MLSVGLRVVGSRRAGVVVRCKGSDAGTANSENPQRKINRQGRGVALATKVVEIEGQVAG